MTNFFRLMFVEGYGIIGVRDVGVGTEEEEDAGEAESKDGRGDVAEKDEGEAENEDGGGAVAEEDAGGELEICSRGGTEEAEGIQWEEDDWNLQLSESDVD
jgi:hypothetical protein